MIMAIIMINMQKVYVISLFVHLFVFILQIECWCAVMVGHVIISIHHHHFDVSEVNVSDLGASQTGELGQRRNLTRLEEPRDV